MIEMPSSLVFVESSELMNATGDRLLHGGFSLELGTKQICCWYKSARDEFATSKVVQYKRAV